LLLSPEVSNLIFNYEVFSTKLYAKEMFGLQEFRKVFADLWCRVLLEIVIKDRFSKLKDSH